MAKQIVKNLVLGDMHSAPNDTELTISCAIETFDLKFPRNTTYYAKPDDAHIYFGFEDYPTALDKDLVYKAVNEIENNIKAKKMYIHCIWGVNRSASVVFIYLVKNRIIKAFTFEKAVKEFRNMYPYFSPNPGWKLFLERNYPYVKR